MAVAYYLVKSMPLGILKILVTAVVFYTAVTLFLSSRKK